MIRRLTGRVVAHDLKAACVEVGGVGWQVFMALPDLAHLAEPQDSVVVVHVHTHLREGAIELFGFLDESALDIFERLISVAGVGPKTALAMLSTLSANDVVEAVQSGDEARLAKAPGIGKKTAARLVLELKDRLLATTTPRTARGAAKSQDPLKDLESALLNLGYRPAQIERAVQAVRALADAGASLEELVREALRRT